jgi:antibiotic biosynthesis monooxygenase (ABM) superfamily enzyme
MTEVERPRPPHGRHKPTVIVARRPRPGRERDFERWIRRLVARATDAPGYVDAEVQPPNDLHPDEWVVVYQFADSASLDTWLRSPTRAALMATGNELVEGAAREQVVAMSPDTDRVTAVSSVRVVPGGADSFRALHDDILVELATSPGFLRADLFEPVEGVQEDTVVVLAFDTRANLDGWLGSDERRRILDQMEQYTEGDRTVNVVGGFAGWFDSTRGAQVRKWKSTVAVLVALIPTSLAFTAVRLTFFPDLHPALATVLGNVIGIVVLTWLLMPVVTRRLDGWLRR